ncbi:hypothetical protein A5684_06140 [Mycobacterium intracellulare]|nr:helix-turn-helix domain-containing protein [Mycobacterium intracellulare]MCA2303187.1 helix-turn-helix domain-containing protein [Mycobacterium intracellulare]OBH66663.1 hypothetical protein A5684_06140 [Mycobacterium intracellulare]
MQELAGQVLHLAGGAAVFAAPVVAQLATLIAFVDSELASSDRIISARYEALFRVLTTKNRVARDSQRDWGAASLGFRHEIDPETAAKALGVKPDTVRKYLRDGILRGRKVGRKWLIPLSAIDDFSRKVA